MGLFEGPHYFHVVCNRYLIELPRWRFEIEPPLSVGSEGDSLHGKLLICQATWGVKKSDCARRLHIQTQRNLQSRLASWLLTKCEFNWAVSKGLLFSGPDNRFHTKAINIQPHKCPRAHTKNNHLHLLISTRPFRFLLSTPKYKALPF